MEVVFRALREAFKIVLGDKNIRLLVHEPHRFACPLEREKPDTTHASVLTPLPVVHWMPSAAIFTGQSWPILSRSASPRIM